MMCVVCVCRTGGGGGGWLVNKGTHPGDVCCVCRMGGGVVSEQRDSSR